MVSPRGVRLVFGCSQVMRITRAVFPSPKKEEDAVNGSGSSSVMPKVKGEQKRKIVTVTTTTSSKVGHGANTTEEEW